MSESAAEDQRDVVLAIDGLTLDFGGVRSLDDVTFDIERGEIFGIIGPNGAGKSTMLNCISGVYRPGEGSILHNGVEIVGMRPDRISTGGISRTFQNVESFPTMTVMDSVLLGRLGAMRAGILAAMAWYGRAAREQRQNRARVQDLLDSFGLGHLAEERVGDLPQGTQRRIELCRAIAAEPDVLLLDEIVAGMTQNEVEETVEVILDAHDHLELTVVLVEHNMDVVMDICDRVAVLEFGRLVTVGPPSEVADDPAVLAAYLGDATATM